MANETHNSNALSEAAIEDLAHKPSDGNHTRDTVPVLDCCQDEWSERDEHPDVARSAIDNALKAVTEVGTLTEAHGNRCGGKLVLLGTRFTVAQLIAELADDGDSVRNVCDNYDLDHEQVVDLLHAIASGFSAPVV